MATKSVTYGELRKGDRVKTKYGIRIVNGYTRQVHNPDKIHMWYIENDYPIEYEATASFAKVI